MKMVKSLLLGSAAGIVAVSGAQAADLPVKAKPVEYVKVCSLYGAGFYYVPGTDICMKVGGYVRWEVFQNFGEHGTTGPWVFSSTSTYSSGVNSRTEGQSDYTTRVRAYAAFDTRQQTAYGTLRTFLNIGVNVDQPATDKLVAGTAGGFNANRAFIQIAGFTFGRATSYYDFYSAPATAYFASPSSDTGDSGKEVMAYTAQFGNGISGSLSLEAGRNGSRINTGVTGTSNGLGLLNAAGTGQQKIVMPDVIANLRVDQAWGSAQVMGAIHDASPGYWMTSTTTVLSGTSHPSNAYGWAAGAGIKINTPFISPGDYFQAQVNYAVGAGQYVATSLGSATAFARNGGSFGYGVNTDGVYDSTSNVAGTALQLTTFWGVNAAYEHFWTPALRTSLYGSYMSVQYNATANALLCGTAATGGGTATGFVFQSGSIFTNPGGCRNNYSWWTVGSRSQWNVTKDFYVGLDTIYMKLNTANSGATLQTGTSFLSMPAGLYTISDQSIWATRFRVHRDIVP